ncbi:MAG: MMPL family transporter, partial [Gammaproteobacteria bacterium]|nr:MMPL family transporter [Gammaproteobacteria bacterium]
SLKKPSTSSASKILQQALNNYAKFIESKKSHFGIGSIMFVLLLGGIPLIHIDDNFVDYFNTSSPFRIQTDRATELLSGPNHIEVLVSNADDPAGVFSSNYLQTIDSLSQYIRDSAHVSNVHSFFDLMQQVANAVAPNSDIQTASPAELAQWFLVYELSLRRGQSNSDFVNRHQNESRISVLLGESSSREIQRLEADIFEWQKIHAPDLGVKVTGENIPVAHLSELNIKSLIVGLGGSIFLTFVLVAGVFRRLKLGIAALISVLVPILCGFGVWGWTVGSIGLASTAIVALTVGVVVDDAIHLVYRYLDGTTRLSLNPWQSSAYSIHRAGIAVTTTSIVMVGGLSVLLFSAFKVNSSFGAGTCLIIALALLFDLMVLPRILVWADD